MDDIEQVHKADFLICFVLKSSLGPALDTIGVNRRSNMLNPETRIAELSNL